MPYNKLLDRRLLANNRLLQLNKLRLAVERRVIIVKLWAVSEVTSCMVIWYEAKENIR